MYSYINCTQRFRLGRTWRNVSILIYYVRAQSKKETNEGWPHDLRLLAHDKLAPSLFALSRDRDIENRMPSVRCGKARKRNKSPNLCANGMLRLIGPVMASYHG